MSGAMHPTIWYTFQSFAHSVSRLRIEQQAWRWAVLKRFASRICAFVLGSVTGITCWTHFILSLPTFALASGWIYGVYEPMLGGLPTDLYAPGLSLTAIVCTMRSRRKYAHTRSKYPCVNDFLKTRQAQVRLFIYRVRLCSEKEQQV